MKNKDNFKMFACCEMVKGFRRSLIYDLQRDNSIFIPNILFDIIKKNPNKTLAEIKRCFDNKYNDIIDDYFSFLEKNEMLFACSKAELKFFPALSKAWDYPAIISNAIIDIKDIHNLSPHIFSELINLRCDNLQIKIFTEFSLSEIHLLGDLFERTPIKYIDLYIKYTPYIIEEELILLVKKYPRVGSVVVFSAPFFRKIPLTDPVCNFLFVKGNIDKKNSCLGYISKLYFSIEPNLFTESQLHNTCLNRKICIDANGEIKNCPSMSRSFGNIKDTTLKEAIEKPGFKDLWFICKDKIDVCKDCEFRHMCTDCRAFIKDPNNIYSQPAKCTYNPYIAKWKGEEGYVPVEECGTYTKETGFVVDKKKVNKLNEEIWK